MNTQSLSHNKQQKNINDKRRKISKFIAKLIMQKNEIQTFILLFFLLLCCDCSMVFWDPYKSLFENKLKIKYLSHLVDSFLTLSLISCITNITREREKEREVSTSTAINDSFIGINRFELSYQHRLWKSFYGYWIFIAF
jgi:hypothetical protein